MEKPQFEENRPAEMSRDGVSRPQESQSVQSGFGNAQSIFQQMQSQQYFQGAQSQPFYSQQQMYLQNQLQQLQQQRDIK